MIALLHLPEGGAGGQFLRVAVASISAMMARQPVLARRYINEPLMRPLMQLAGGIHILCCGTIQFEMAIVKYRLILERHQSG